MTDTLAKLAQVLESRKSASADTSYVAAVYRKGLDHILKKIGEEASELIIAGKAGDNTAIVYETADLWFHTLILLAARGLHPQDVLQELERRAGRSGLEERAARTKVSD